MVHRHVLPDTKGTQEGQDLKINVISTFDWDLAPRCLNQLSVRRIYRQLLRQRCVTGSLSVTLQARASGREELKVYRQSTYENRRLRYKSSLLLAMIPSHRSLLRGSGIEAIKWKEITCTQWPATYLRASATSIIYAKCLVISLLFLLLFLFILLALQLREQQDLQ